VPRDRRDRPSAPPGTSGSRLHKRGIEPLGDATWERTFDAVPDLIAIVDQHHRIVRANRAMAQRLGLTPDECVGKVCFEVVHGLGCPPEFCPHTRTLADGGEHMAEVHEPGLGGEFLVTTTPLVDEQGLRLGSVHVARDITERKRAEEALQNLASFPGENPNPVIRVARDGTLIYANEGSRPLLELWGCEAGASLPPEPHQWVESALAAGEPATAEIICEDRTFLVTCAPVAGRDHVNIYGADITERKRAEETLRHHREDLARAQAVAHTGSWRLDVRRNELLWSDETHRMFGIPKGTPMTYETFLGAVHPEDREYVDRGWTAALRGEPYDIEHRIVVGDSVRWVREQAELEFDEQGTLLGGFGTVQDITERKLAEEALDRLRTEFMGMVTHELKTPLTAIKGSAATALGSQRPLVAEENRELFQIIDEQADRLRELMDNLLDATRIEAGTLSVSPEPTDLRQVLEEARATFARGGGLHQIRLEVPAGMPRVYADRRRLFQVLMNLLNNAGMFSSPTEPITITAEHDSLQVTVHVRDRGRGIPKEKLPLLFKKFSRLHDDLGQKLSGTGLGLAICKGIVEAHGGRIWADSGGECEGSTFSFTLPVASEVSVKALSDEARRAVHLRCNHPGRVRRPGERTRVLAVDDEPQILRFLRRSLDEAGYQPIVTADPCEVAKLVELEEPDLVLLDLKLPGTSGFELLERIREFSGVPVIFLTGSDREEDAVRALREGADDYITKPFSPSELLARIGAALRRRVLPDMMEARPAFTLGDLTIDFAERRVTVAGHEVALSATEYKILHQLATHAGRPISYEQLLRQVWGPEYSQETELVRSFIRNLRRKLGDDAQNPRFILTERQVGYRMPKP
jgi:PAS domain S-box-containing protein